MLRKYRHPAMEGKNDIFLIWFLDKQIGNNIKIRIKIADRDLNSAEKKLPSHKNKSHPWTNALYSQ